MVGHRSSIRLALVLALLAVCTLLLSWRTSLAEDTDIDHPTYIEVGDYRLAIEAANIVNYGKVEFADGTFALLIHLKRDQVAAMNREIDRVGLAYMSMVLEDEPILEDVSVGGVGVDPFFIGPLTESQAERAFQNLGVSVR